MQEKTRGVVLHLLRYNDESVIVDIYTETRGLVAFLVSMPKHRKGGNKAVLLRPLNVLDLVFDYRPNAGLQRIREMRVSVPYLSLPYDSMKQVVALFLSEFLYHALKHEGRNPSLFEYVCQSLLWLDETGRGVANFHIVFLIRMTRFLGFWPNLEGMHTGALFDLQDACMVSVPPPHGAYLEAAEATMLPLFLRVSITSAHLLLLNRQQRARVLEVIMAYYRLHIPEFPELKSLDVLRDVFA